MYAVDVSAAEGPWAAAVLLHPHPGMGGNRFNAVVDILFRALPDEGVRAARFDFASSDETASARQAVEVIDTMRTRPLILVGYSYGASIAARVTHEALAGWFLIAPPLRSAGAPIAGDPRPKALAVPQFDQFSPPDDVRRHTAGWINTTVEVVSGADHFMAGGTRAVVSQLLAWLRSGAVDQVGPARPAPRPGGDDSSLPASS
jgi:alpha/beta superfamily hydrolase